MVPKKKWVTDKQFQYKYKDLWFTIFATKSLVF